MNIKRYIGKTTHEAMARVKRDLGSEAVILHTRKIKQKGIRGWFSKPLVEVIAAVEEKQPEPPVDLAQQLQSAINQANAEQTASDNQYQAEIRDLKDQVGNLTELVENVIKNIDVAKDAAKVQEANASTVDVAGDQVDAADTTSAVNPILEKLRAQNVSPAVVDEIDRRVALLALDQADNMAIYAANTGVVIRDMIGEPYSMESVNGARQVFFFVGPTGVGKTTTLAKIAAKLSLIDEKRVALITADTYRIAAVDQLKTYSEILSIPLDVVYEAEDVVAVLEKRADYDYILVDTAGRNHKLAEGKDDLKALIDAANQAHVFLVMSLTSSAQDIESILKSYAFLEDYKLIFTKMDEAETLGSLLNAKYISNKPLSFITNGQSVPDDIVEADADRLTRALLGDSYE
ncbi:MAG: flagellar biosynthesis protein FlhF [Clostridiales bacterium]|nr:MAG: flagellar biosynthesis protein FlhF [Clostridiales bacterium]